MAAFNGTIIKAATGGELGRQYKVTGSYALTGAIANTDTITWSGILPASGSRIVGGKVWGVELDTNATPTGTLVIGDGVTANGYLTTKGAAVGLQNSLGGQLSYFFDGELIGQVVTNKNVVLAITAAVATGAATGTVFIELDLEAL